MSHVSEPRVWFTGNPSANPIDFTGGHFLAHGSISCRFCSHLVTLLSITYLHLICYPFYNHPCNLPTFPQFIWTHELRMTVVFVQHPRLPGTGKPEDTWPTQRGLA